MASKKTGRKDDGAKGASDNASDAPEAEAVAVSDTNASTGTSQDTPETVDAEIVDETEGRDEPMASDPADTDRTDGTGGPTDGDGQGGDGPNDGDGGKKKGAGGFIVGLLVLAAVLAALFFVFQDDILGTDEPAVAETTPGVVVSEAEPFPGNELDGEQARRPITAEAAPGAREAAVAADADDTPVNALRARAAEQARLRREAREAEQGTQASQPRTGFVSEDDDGEMAAAVRQARAEQARIRREDRERAAATRADGADAAAGAAPLVAVTRPQGQDDAATDQDASDRDARVAALRAQRERDAQDGTSDQDSEDTQARSDDPNALPGFTVDADDTGDAGQQDERDEAAATLRDRMAGQDQDDDQASDAGTDQDGAQAARPTGRIRPIAPARDGEGDEGDADDERSDDPNALAQQERPRRIQPRPPVIRTAPDAQDARDRTITPDMVPSSVATDEELEERLVAVEADLRDALRQDLRAEVREDVLAEASQRIDQAIQQTEREVAQLRTQLGEQEARSDQRIAQLRDRLEVLQDRDASANTRGVLILALSNLRGQLDAGQPFERQLDDVERVAPNVTTLREARRFAGTGLPTDADLRERFRDAEREALRREAGEGADGFFAGMWANIKGLFTVREIGEVEGEETEAVISRARAALARGEVGVAVQEIDQLDGVAAEAFAPFVEEARAKSATKLQIQRLERAVLDQPERG